MSIADEIARLAEIATYGREVAERRTAYFQLQRVAGDVRRMERALDDIAGGAMEDEQAAFDLGARPEARP